MRVFVVAILLALPAPVYLAYLGAIGRTSPDWRYFWPNYAWCAAILFIATLILAGARARFETWLTALSAGNLALIGFCFWMASLLSRGYRDTEIAWVFLFPVQVAAIVLACLAHNLLRRRHRAKKSAGAFR